MTIRTILLVIFVSGVSSLSCARRQFLATACAAPVALFVPSQAIAAPDCMTDCLKNCKQIAPKDPKYCLDNCNSYCEQPDRQDGLSGSVGSEAGYSGILGGTFGQGTVPKGEDKPPAVNLPGLDFTSQSGKKLLGY
mmetsp:Transcript_40728/g.57261  ORF Transcript_40728/g.57261 Transcript_40728/m.57261 type:complete len:136 (-) Transcript_40728:2884-3291(-)